MVSTIQKFYDGRVVFLTGGSGFFGRVLLLKLLQSCPNIKSIIVFLRKKRGQGCQERLFNILSSSEFSAVPKDRLLKVSSVEGDMEKEGLGLSSEDREFLLTSQISVVFHIAASVRLHEPLVASVKSNALPVIELIGLCEEMPEIKALVYVSTAYSQCPHSEIKEEVYPLPIEYKQIFDGKIVDEETMMKVRKNGDWPNSYTFSKALAEEMFQKLNGHFPVAIFRPSLVTNAWKEPKPGWINNTYSITRVLRTAYMGYDRVGLFTVDKVGDLVPVDMCVNAMIATAWETAKSENRGQMKVYNFVSGAQNPITWKEYWSICGQKIIENPPSHALWYYFYVKTKLWPVYFSLWLCLDMLPAFLIQALQYCSSPGSKSSIKEALHSLHYTILVKYFGDREWKFHDTNVRSLLAKLTPEDCDIFGFDIKKLNWNEYLESCVKGVRQYILKDDLSTLPQARKRYKMLYACHCAVIVSFLYLCCSAVWRLATG